MQHGKIFIRRTEEFFLWATQLKLFHVISILKLRQQCGSGSKLINNKMWRLIKKKTCIIPFTLLLLIIFDLKHIHFSFNSFNLLCNYYFLLYKLAIIACIDSIMWIKKSNQFLLLYFLYEYFKTSQCANSRQKYTKVELKINN